MNSIYNLLWLLCNRWRLFFWFIGIWRSLHRIDEYRYEKGLFEIIKSYAERVRTEVEKRGDKYAS